MRVTALADRGGGLNLFRKEVPVLGAREDKARAVEELKEKLSKTRGAVLTDYRGLNVAEVTDLRQKLRVAGIEYRVVKNTLLRRASELLELSGLHPFIEGPTAVAFGYDDPAVAARAIVEFGKTHKALEVKAGLLEGRVIGAALVKELASLPPRDQMLAKVLYAMTSPLAGLATVLSAPVRGLVFGLEALRRQREAEGQAGG